MKKTWLILETGEKFEGFSFGAAAARSGELVFNTAAASYCETLTDPRSAGCITLFTFPLLGNYGVPEGDMPDGECRANGVVARESCLTPSNFRSKETLDSYLKRNGVPGICGIDTRAVVRLLREHGSVRAIISDDEAAAVAPETADLTLEASCAEPYTVGGGAPVAVLDLGAGKYLAGALAAMGCKVRVFPCDTPPEDILAGGYRGAALSAGPGSPEYSAARIKTAERLMGKLPIMGVGLGHQLMALAAGGKCERLSFGHHGASCPVMEKSTGRVLMTEQNHLWTALSGIQGSIETYVNLTDGSCEGLAYPELNAFSLQFYPDGQSSQEYSYKSFVRMMGGND